MLVGELQDALLRTYDDIGDHHTLQMAAALSYYFVMSLFPSLIVLSAIVAYLPVPDLFDQALNLMARFIPPDSMGVVKKVLADVVTPNRNAFLSAGLLGTLWAASGGFAAAIEALNIAYDNLTNGFGRLIADHRSGSDDRRSSVRQLALGKIARVSLVAMALAIHSLDDFYRLYRGGG